MGNNLKNQHYKNIGITLQMDTLTFEAESVAYVVCQHFGIDTSDYSFAYVASWSRDRELSDLKASFNVIQKTAGSIIDGIEEKFKTHELDQVKTMVQKAADKLPIEGMTKAMEKPHGRCR